MGTGPMTYLEVRRERQNVGSFLRPDGLAKQLRHKLLSWGPSLSGWKGAVPSRTPALSEGPGCGGRPAMWSHQLGELAVEAVSHPPPHTTGKEDGRGDPKPPLTLPGGATVVTTRSGNSGGQVWETPHSCRATPSFPPPRWPRAEGTLGQVQGVPLGAAGQEHLGQVPASGPVGSAGVRCARGRGVLSAAVPSLGTSRPATE